jgi:phage anti-repressor protein
MVHGAWNLRTPFSTNQIFIRNPIHQWSPINQRTREFQWYFMEYQPTNRYLKWLLNTGPSQQSHSLKSGPDWLILASRQEPRKLRAHAPRFGMKHGGLAVKQKPWQCWCLLYNNHQEFGIIKNSDFINNRHFTNDEWYVHGSTPLCPGEPQNSR